MIGQQDNSTNQGAISNSFSGRTILVTRSAEQSSEFRAQLEMRGASVLCVPTIEIVDPDSWQACDNIIWKLVEYQAVCFTSKNAVIKLLQRIRTIRPQALDMLSTRNIYAVGEKTQSALESAGFSVTATPKNASAEELAKLFQAHNIRGEKILFPKSNIARDILPEQLRTLGAIVEEVVVYKTVIPKTENLETIRNLMSDRKIDIITFFSPSSVWNFAEMIGTELLQNINVAVIGPTTAKAVKEIGIEPVVVAKISTSEGLIQEIERFLNAT
jgi:uroporphyrinogen-III synthase